MFGHFFTKEMTKIMEKHWRSLGAFWTKLVWTPIRLIVMEKQFEKTLLELGWKNKIGNVCSFIENNGDFCQKMWMTSKSLERRRMRFSWRKRSYKMWTLTNHVISWPRTLAMYSAWMQTEWKINELCQNIYVNLRIFAGAIKKLPG